MLIKKVVTKFPIFLMEKLTIYNEFFKFSSISTQQIFFYRHLMKKTKILNKIENWSCLFTAQIKS